MGKPLPLELRQRVVAYVDEGHGHREAARHFRVSPRFVNKTHSAKLSAIAATCSSQLNAETSSRLPDTRLIDRDTL